MKWHIMERNGGVNMFMGEFYHGLDEKGRMIMPSKLRQKLGDTVVVTRGYDGCISVYTLDGWKKIYEKLQTYPTTKKDARIYVRMLTAKASECDLDKQGRINIPTGLIEEADLGKECVIVGVVDHIEIWSKERWDAYSNDANESFEDIAEQLVDFEL